MKAIYALLPLSLALTSCALVDPDYAAYQRKQNGATATTQAPATSNPYGVPGQDSAQYQEVTNVNPPYTDTPVAAPTTPSYTPPSTPSYSGGGSTHTVAPGDSLWGISRKYGTSVEAIQSANGLSGTTIRPGQSLQIPR